MNPLARLDAATLDQLMAEFPAEWKAFGEQLVIASKQGPAALYELITASQRAAAPWVERIKKSHGNPQVLEQALPKLAAARMARLAIERMLQSAASGVETGSVRLSFFAGTVIQRLLFSKGLTRKPASMTAFRLLWPLLGDNRRRLLTLVQPKGIYCFYSAQLIAGLATLIAGRECLEIAAGDGTLSRFLTAHGVPARATDDFSWSHAVTYPADVEKLDADAALAKYKPAVVLCSFPPPGNPFEKRVLANRDVALYLVLTTRNRFAAGDWAAYENSGRLEINEPLSALLLPPEIEPVVLTFRRS